MLQDQVVEENVDDEFDEEVSIRTWDFLTVLGQIIFWGGCSISYFAINLSSFAIFKPFYSA